MKNEDHDVAAQTRLRNLISASNAVVSDLDLSTVLKRIVEAATDLVDARYGAMGVIGPDGALEQFIHVGMDDDLVAKIGHLPEGKGLLGALIADPTPVRLPKLADDPRSIGFPPHHPPMESFLGVPLRVRDEVYGNLYFTDHKGGSFSADDEEIARSLASTAGIAISNARLFDEVSYRQRWSMALAETTRLMLMDDDQDPLQVLAERVAGLADADLTSVVIHQAGHELVAIASAVGVGAETLFDAHIAYAGSAIERTLEQDTPVIEAIDGDGAPSHTMQIPFSAGHSTRGLLTVCRSEKRPAFRERDLNMAASFADQARLAVERAAARENGRKVVLLEERSRIARDLHDHVIQGLYAAGLSLQAVASTVGPGEVAERIMAQIRQIDESIAQIRESIFALKSDAPRLASGLRARILEIVARLAENQVEQPRVRFLGPVDLLADPSLHDDVAAVVTETLTNAIRHAQATAITLTVSAAGGEFTVDVVDDGVGMGTTTRRSGLANLTDRAEQRGGSFEIEDVLPRGSRLLWHVPV
ncbi:two-component system sensor histidine kinase [soil metagenome]